MVITRDEEGDAVGETLAKLMREHPSRLVVLRVKPGEEASLSERVFAQCWIPFGGRQQICCEQIEITTTEAGLKDAGRGTRIEAPDLPVVIWTRVPGILLREACAGLLELADKVIVDSQGWAQHARRFRDPPWERAPPVRPGMDAPPAGARCWLRSSITRPT